MARKNDDPIEVVEENFGELLIQGLREVRAVAAGEAEPARRTRRELHAGEQSLVLKPEVPGGSPFDVEGVKLGVTTEEIVDFVREGRRDADAPRPMKR